MSLNTDLQTLKTNIEGVKSTLYTNLTNKGVTNITETDTLSTLADKVATITVGEGGSGGSGIDFSPIGYDAELSAELNSVWNNDVAYSKTLYDAWNPNSSSALEINPPYNYELVYYPAYPVEELTDVKNIYCYKCSKMVVFPIFNSDKVRIGQNAFYGCSSIEKLDLSGTLQQCNLKWAFEGCVNLKKIMLPPNGIVSTVEGLYYTFYNCKLLTEIDNLTTLNTSSITTLDYTFCYCESLKKIDISDWDTSLVKSTNYLFNECKAIEELAIPDNLGELCTSWSNFISGCKALKTITGSISLKGTTSSINNGGITGYSSLDKLRKFTIKNIGYTSSCKSIEVRYLTVWGVNSDEIPDARQSLIDSLITYSFDRASAGYPTCTITLSSNTKSLLTDDEIAQITAKGFTIA